jgi:hypothetical protein
VILSFKPIDQWPEGWRDSNRQRKPNPFRAKYRDTLAALDYELGKLGARDAFLQVDADPSGLRLDGQLRADAKVNHPGVILTIDTREHGVVVYPCDTFESRWSQDGPSWQVNLRAIAGGLEALRKVERYGIADRGQQYAGFGALPPARAMGAGMTTDEAARFLIEHGEWGGSPGDPDVLIDDPEIAEMYYRNAAKSLQPDKGCDPDLFRRATTARDLLVGAS